MIVLNKVSLKYPLIDVNAHSLQIAMYKRVAGMIGGNLKNFHSVPYVQALNNISITVKEGQRLALIGHNGAGKTTLLRVMSGIYTPSSGNVKIEGRVSSLTDFTLGMDPDVTGVKNIIFRLVFMGYTFKQANEALPEIIEFSGLGEFINLPVRTYSTGMFLRLAFAISTHFLPDILVLDEIIGAGDQAFRDRTEERLDNLFKQSRIVVLSSHDAIAIERYCDTAVLLNKGEILEYGKTKEVLKEYKNLVDKELI